MAQEQIELEFRDELLQVQQMQAQIQTQPQLQMEVQKLLTNIESRKARLIAEMTKDYMEEENKIYGDVNDDPLTKLKKQELDLRARENEQKARESEQKIEIDRAKLVQDQEFKYEKLEQDDENAKLRAGISLAKMGVQNMKIMEGGNG
jgi:organic radical activating enzyme